MSDNEAELRRLWIEAGGSFHGPNVEHGSMPEAKLLPFLGALVKPSPPAGPVELHDLVLRTREQLHDSDEALSTYLDAAHAEIAKLRKERDDAFVEAKAQQDRRFEALRERDEWRTKWEGANADRDAKAAECDIAKASAQTACEQLTQQMARSDELAAKLARAEEARDAARFQPLGDNHHNALACPYCNPKRIDPDAADDAPPVTPLHPVKDVGVQVENKKTGKRHEWDGTAWRPLPAPAASIDGLSEYDELCDRIADITTGLVVGEGEDAEEPTMKDRLAFLRRCVEQATKEKPR